MSRQQVTIVMTHTSTSHGVDTALIARPARTSSVRMRRVVGQPYASGHVWNERGASRPTAVLRFDSFYVRVNMIAAEKTDRCPIIPTPLATSQTWPCLLILVPHNAGHTAHYSLRVSLLFSASVSSDVTAQCKLFYLLTYLLKPTYRPFIYELGLDRPCSLTRHLMTFR